jgi:glycerophosphoryl diester phosphodiesterase
VGLSADNVLVIAHDPYLNAAITRTADGKFLAAAGPGLRTLKYDEIRRFDVGRINPDTPYGKTFSTQVGVDNTPIPRLIDLFELLARRNDHKTRFNIETKIRPDRPHETVDAQTFVTYLLAAINTYGLPARVTIQSFDWRTLQLVQAQAPNIQTVYLSVQQTWLNNIAPTDGSNWLAGMRLGADGSVPHLVHQAGGQVWSPYYKDLTADSLKQAKAWRLKVIPWTVNTQAEMKVLIDMGVDGIITDRPDLLLPLVR